MTIRLNGQTSGYVELEAPAAAGSNTLVLPTGNGSSGQYLQTNGSGTLSWQTVSTSNLTVMTALDASSGTNKSFSVPTTAKKITVSVFDLSTTGTQNIVYRLGTGGSAKTSGYKWSKHIDQGSGATVQSTTNGNGFEDFAEASGCVRHGQIVFTYVKDHVWTAVGQWGRTDTGAMHYTAGSIDVGGAVNYVDVNVPGSDSFDAGTIGLMYEV